MEKKILFQGAESKIYTQQFLGQTILVKERFVKKYRNPELDACLTKERIKAECRNIMRCKQAGVRTPAIYSVDLEKNIIFMEYFENSLTIKQLINKLQADKIESSLEDLKKLADKIGTDLSKMHEKGIVHGDLTSSNMLLVDGELVFIDFGLSSSNASAEDKAVDLYVLERALLSTHANIEMLFTEIIEAYKKQSGKQGKNVLTKFEDVRARGRKRTMVG